MEKTPLNMKLLLTKQGFKNSGFQWKKDFFDGAISWDCIERLNLTFDYCLSNLDMSWTCLGYILQQRKNSSSARSKTLSKYSWPNSCPTWKKFSGIKFVVEKIFSTWEMHLVAHQKIQMHPLHSVCQPNAIYVTFLY